MKSLKILTAVILSTFAVAAQAGPYGPGGPGGPGCPAGVAPGSSDCPATGAGGPGGPGRGGAGMQERLKAADTNADGKISRDEAKALPGIAANFEAIDKDKDGFVTLQELQASRQARHAGGQRGDGWKKWDANGDGQLSSAEVANAPRLQQNFKAIDTNGDGFLSPEEIQAAHQQMRGKGRQG
jgi:Ca2+-binding EF-hand superfamily protein